MLGNNCKVHKRDSGLPFPRDRHVRQSFCGEVLLIAGKFAVATSPRVTVKKWPLPAKLQSEVPEDQNFHFTLVLPSVSKGKRCFPPLFWQFGQMLQTQEAAQNAPRKLLNEEIRSVFTGRRLCSAVLKHKSVFLPLKDANCCDAASLTVLVYGPTCNYRGGEWVTLGLPNTFPYKKKSLQIVFCFFLFLFFLKAKSSITFAVCSKRHCSVETPLPQPLLDRVGGDVPWTPSRPAPWGEPGRLGAWLWLAKKALAALSEPTARRERDAVSPFCVQ